MTIQTAPDVAAAERVVVAAAREFRRTGGRHSYHELMDAVLQLERAMLAAEHATVSCFCGTGRGHPTGTGRYCRKPASDADG